MKRWTTYVEKLIYDFCAQSLGINDALLSVGSVNGRNGCFLLNLSWERFRVVQAHHPKFGHGKYKLILRQYIEVKLLHAVEM